MLLLITYVAGNVLNLLYSAHNKGLTLTGEIICCTIELRKKYASKKNCEETENHRIELN